LNIFEDFILKIQICNFVYTASAEYLVTSPSAGEHIISTLSIKDVISPPPSDIIISSTSMNNVIPLATVNLLVATVSPEIVCFIFVVLPDIIFS
jgi:hypothetical protein